LAAIPTPTRELNVKPGGDSLKNGILLPLSILISLITFFASSWAAESGGSYTIGSGDILEIVTWKEPDFSREEVLVRTDGFISFPLLNDVRAAGLTPTELKKALESGIRNYVSSPEVTVTIATSGSQRFYILGEVVNTGEYPLAKHLTVLQAFALAGGFTEWASKDEIILMRNDGGKTITIRVDYKDIAEGRNLEQNVAIKADDTIIVP
jgi:polysaccharide export outer membrane protein